MTRAGDAVLSALFDNQGRLVGYVDRNNVERDLSGAALQPGTRPAGTMGNVAITGGTIDGTPVGATTASTGRFTGLKVAEGANAKQGTAVLVAGAVTVSNTSVTANSRIFLTSQADGGAPGFLRVSARVAGASFTITSSSGTDTSTVAYEIFEPA